MPRFRLSALGGLTVEGIDAAAPATITQRKRLALLALLAAADPPGIARERLLLLLWPESTTERARGALHQLLYVVRQALGETCVLGTNELRFDPSIVSSDVGDFQAALMRGDLAAAVDLYRGPFLDAFYVAGAPELERWIDQKRQELARGYQTALSRLSAQAMERRDFDAAVVWAERLIAADPLSDRATVLLMEALAASGDVTAALERARIHAAVVRQELATDVDPSVTVLASRLRAEATTPRTVAAPRVHATPSSPGPVSAPSINPRWRKRTLAPAFATVIVASGIVLAHAFSARRSHEREFVVVADFATAPADSGIADMLTTATRRALSASRSLGTAPESQLAEARKRLKLSPDARLNDSLARHLAMGLGLKTVVTGQLTSFPGGYGLSLKLVSAASGNVVASAGTTGLARDTDLIPALDALTRTLRKNAGDDLEAIHRQPSLLAMTSTSLEAMADYVASEREHSLAKRIELLQEAVRLDSSFALALWQLSLVMANAGAAPAVRHDLLARAYAHRDRLTEYERLRIEVAFRFSRSGDTPNRGQLIERDRRIVEEYPSASDERLLAYLYMSRQELAPAESLLRRALASDSTNNEAYFSLVRILVATKRVSAARKMINALPPNVLGRDVQDALVSYAEGHRDAVRKVFEAGTRTSIDGGGAAYLNLARLNMLEGRVADWQHDLQAAIPPNFPAKWPYAFPFALEKANYWVLKDPGAGLRLLDAEVAADPTKRRDIRTLTLYAQFGEPSRARSLLPAYDSVTKPGFDEGAERRLAMGWIFLAENKWREAVTEFRGSAMQSDGPVTELPIAVDAEVGLAFEAAGRRDSAIASYEHYLDTPTINHFFEDEYKLPLVLQHVARLYEETGKPKKAVNAYSRFVELWRDADPELLRKVREARQRIDALSR